MPILQESNGQYSMFFPKALAKALNFKKGMKIELQVKSQNEICMKVEE